MNSKTIVLNKEKETKNTIRYREETEGNRRTTAHSSDHLHSKVVCRVPCPGKN